MQDRNEMDNRRMHERDREREWEREPGTSYQRERREFRDRPGESSYQSGRREEDENYLSSQRFNREPNWGSQSGYSQRSGEYDPNTGQYANRETGNQYGRERGQGQQWNTSQYGGSQWGSSGRGDYGNQRPGEYGNQRPGEYGNGRDWNDQQQRYGSGRSGGGMGNYGGGLSDYGSGRFSGRGPKGYQRSDDRVREDVCERLTQHPDIDASEIDVKVSNGEVTLTGSVDERHCKRMAEEVAEQCSGVREVHNQIRVQQHHTVGATSGSQSGQSTSGSQQNKKN